MCQHVCLEAIISCAFVFTLIAAELLFSGMNKNVNFQISMAGERGGAHRASVGFISSILYYDWGSERRHCSKFSKKTGCHFSSIGAANGYLPLF